MRRAIVVALAVMLVGLWGCQPSGKTDGSGKAGPSGKAAGPSGEVAAPAPSPAGTVAVEVEKLQLKNAPVQKNAKASGGELVLFDQYNAEVSGTVDLPAGTYKVVLVGQAPDADSDAVELEVASADRAVKIEGANERVFFDKYKEITAASVQPQIKLATPAKVKLIIRASEEQGILLDKVEFQPVKN